MIHTNIDIISRLFYFKKFYCNTDFHFHNYTDKMDSKNKISKQNHDI